MDFIKWPKSIDLATSYSYNSGGGEEHEIYFKTSSNSSKLLQTPPDTFQTLPNPVQTCPNPVQMRPNTSKCVKTCPNASKCSKLVQIYLYLKVPKILHLPPPLFLIISPYWPLVSIAVWTISFRKFEKPQAICITSNCSHVLLCTYFCLLILLKDFTLQFQEKEYGFRKLSKWLWTQVANKGK